MQCKTQWIRVHGLAELGLGLMFELVPKRTKWSFLKSGDIQAPVQKLIVKTIHARRGGDHTKYIQSDPGNRSVTLVTPTKLHAPRAPSLSMSEQQTRSDPKTKQPALPRERQQKK